MNIFLKVLILVGLSLISQTNVFALSSSELKEGRAVVNSVTLNGTSGTSGSEPSWIIKESLEYHIFSGTSNPGLAHKINQEITKESVHLVSHSSFDLVGSVAFVALAEKDVRKVVESSITVGRFNDGEINVQFEENIRKKDIFIIQSTCKTNESSINDHLMELFLMTKAAKRASVGSVTALMPYFGYARQDRKTTARVTISASDVASLIEFSGIDRVIAVDLHCGQIQGFFRNVPVDNLPASLVFAPYVAGLSLVNPVIVSPDAGGAERAYKFKAILAECGVNADYAMISKKRASAGVIESMDLVGDVRGKTAIIIDDICDTGGTLIKAGEELLSMGAVSVYACFTHAVFSKDAVQKLANSCFTQIITTDTIPLRDECPSKIVVLSVAPLLVEVIQRVHNGVSVSEYLNHKVL